MLTDAYTEEYMPTKNARVMLTVKPETLAALRGVAEPSNVPVASLIAQMLDEMVPMLKSMAAAATATKEKRVEAFDHLAEALGEAQVAAGQTQLHLSRSRRKATQAARKKAKRS